MFAFSFVKIVLGGKKWRRKVKSLKYGQLKKNKDKKCTNNKALFRANEYKKYPNTQIRKLTKQEADDYWNKRF